MKVLTWWVVGLSLSLRGEDPHKPLGFWRDVKLDFSCWLAIGELVAILLPHFLWSKTMLLFLITAMKWEMRNEIWEWSHSNVFLLQHLKIVALESPLLSLVEIPLTTLSLYPLLISSFFLSSMILIRDLFPFFLDIFLLSLMPIRRPNDVSLSPHESPFIQQPNWPKLTFLLTLTLTAS